MYYLENADLKTGDASPAAFRGVGRVWVEGATVGQAGATKEVGVVETAVARWFAVRQEDSAGSFVGGAVQFGAGLTGAEMQSEAAAAADGAHLAASFPAMVGFELSVTAAAAAAAVVAAGTDNNSSGCLEPERSARAAECFGSKGLARFAEYTSEGCLILAELG
jgi:hypothetical protein